MSLRQIFTDNEYRSFIVALREEITQRRLSVAAAAKILGVTRQTLYLHLCSDPKHQLRWRTVGRAVRTWGMTVQAQGKKFDKEAFRPETLHRESATQLLLLPEAIERLEDADIEVRVDRKSASAVVLQVLLKFAG